MQKFVKIHETGRAEKLGETLTFVGKQLKMIEQGFTLEGNKRVVEALIKDAQVEHAKRVDTANYCELHAR